MPSALVGKRLSDAAKAAVNGVAPGSAPLDFGFELRRLRCLGVAGEHLHLCLAAKLLPTKQRSVRFDSLWQMCLSSGFASEIAESNIIFDSAFRSAA